MMPPPLKTSEENSRKSSELPAITQVRGSTMCKKKILQVTIKLFLNSTARVSLINKHLPGNLKLGKKLFLSPTSPRSIETRMGEITTNQINPLPEEDIPGTVIPDSNG